MLLGNQKAIREDLVMLMLGQQELMRHFIEVENEVLGQPLGPRNSSDSVDNEHVGFGRSTSPSAAPRIVVRSEESPMRSAVSRSRSKDGNLSHPCSPKSIGINNRALDNQRLRRNANKMLGLPVTTASSERSRPSSTSKGTPPPTSQGKQAPQLAVNAQPSFMPSDSHTLEAAHPRITLSVSTTQGLATGSKGSMDSAQLPKINKQMTRDSTGGGVGLQPTLKHQDSLHSSSQIGSDSSLLQGGQLPEGWPQVIGLRDIFFPDSDDEAGENGSVRKLSAAISASSDAFRELEMANQIHATQQRSKCSALFAWLWRKTFIQAMKPHSRPVLVRDFIGVSLLLLELVVNPFVLAWDVRVAGWLLVYATCMAVFWSLEMWSGFLTGYTKRGEMATAQPGAAFHYLRHGFIMDIVLVSIDWLNVVFAVSGNTSTELRIIKILRFLKVVRIARLFNLLEKIPIWRVPRLAFAFQHMIFVKLVVGTLLANHLLACGWHLLGQEGRADTDLRWGRSVSMHTHAYPDGLGFTIDDYPILYQYLTALHWTVAQMTLGASDVTPVNSGERMYNIMLLFLGLVVGSTCVSLVSAEIIKYTVTKRDQAVLVESLWRYMSQNTVPTQLRMRVMAQVNERLVERLAQLSEDDVGALGLLSASLRQELTRATREPHLRTHNLFSMWVSLDPKAFNLLCAEAVSFCFLSPQDELFLAGNEGDEAYCAVRGRLCYTQLPGRSMAKDYTEKMVHEGAWLSEAVLWSHWLHVGDAVARTSCQFLTVNARRFSELLERMAGVHRHIRALTVLYGRNYHVRIVAAVPPHADWPTDLNVPFTDPSDLFSRHVSLGILRRSEKLGHSNLTDQQRRTLENEVIKEKCAIRARGGNIERIVHLTALRVRDHEGLVLHCLGNWRHGETFRVDCKLPGSKRANGELPSVALDRILEDLGGMADLLTIHGTTLDVNEKESEQFGVPTVYYRTIYEATLAGGSRKPEDINMSAGWLEAADSVEGLETILSQPVILNPFMEKKALGNSVYAFVDEDESTQIAATAKGLKFELTGHTGMCF